VIRLGFRPLWLELLCLISTLQKPLYRGCFTLIYAYGLRITEAVTLPVSAVDSKQMLLRVIGKRNKERILPLTDSVHV